MQEDWRLTNQMEYLYRAVLKKAELEITAANDHEHCEFCWDKFGTGEDLLHTGYCTADGYHWICERCFHDFQAQFDWKLTED